MKILLLAISLLCFQFSFSQVTKVWEIDTVCKGAECVVYDNIRNCLYVSNFNKFPGDGSNYNEDCISKVSIDGKIMEKSFINNLSSPTGMCIYNDRLYIVERFGIVVANLANRTVETRYRIRNGGFLNDICIDSSGIIYVTDSDSAAVYSIKNGKVEQWLKSPDISNPNGIILDGNNLIIGVNGDNYLKSISISDKKISNIAAMGPGIIDGIKKHGNDYFVSLYAGNLYLVQRDGKITELLNTRKNKINCADFEYVEKIHLFIIPALSNSKVTGYKYIY
jgi:sugar lactone lactonase YvrE